MNEGKFMQLTKKDAIKTFIMFVMSGFLVTLFGSLMPVLQNGDFPEWPQFLKTLRFAAATSAASGMSYLLKNLLTNSDDQFLKKENTPKEPPHTD